MIKKMVKTFSLALLLACTLGAYANTDDVRPLSPNEEEVKITSGCNCPMCWTGCKCGDCWDCTPLYE